MKRFFLIFLLTISSNLFAEFSSNTESAPKGSSITLTWSSSSSSCNASDSWSGTKSGSGSEEIVLPEEGWNLFTLNCGDTWEYVWVWGSAEVVSSSASNQDSSEEATTTTNESSSESNSSEEATTTTNESSSESNSSEEATTTTNESSSESNSSEEATTTTNESSSESDNSSTSDSTSSSSTSSDPDASPSEISVSSEVLSLGYDHSCMIDDTGVVCWGSNAESQTDIPVLSNPTQVKAGYYYSCAIDDNGVTCWGRNAYGNTDPPVLTNIMQVALSNSFSCALENLPTGGVDGITCWGEAYFDGFTDVLDPPSILEPSQIAVGSSFSCAIFSNTREFGSFPAQGLYCWGRIPIGRGLSAGYGGDINLALSNPTEIRSTGHYVEGGDFVCALHDDGVTCSGSDEFLISSVPSLINPTQLSLGFDHACVLDQNSVNCWGRNSFQQSDVPILINPTQVSAGGNFSCALDETGVVCWGRNNLGQTDVPNLSNPIWVKAGQYHSCAFDDNGLVCWGQNDKGQTEVPALTFSGTTYEGSSNNNSSSESSSAISGSSPAASNPVETTPTEAPPGNDPFGGFDFGFFDNFAFFQPVAAPPDTSSPVAGTQPSTSTPAASTPTASNPSTSTPAASTPTASNPSTSTPAASTPTASNPSTSTPAASTPTASNPSSGSVTAEETPTEAPPGNDPFGGFDFGFFDNFAFFQPVAAPPSISTPSTSTPAASTPTASTPSTSTPVASTPAASNPSTSTPAASTPAATTPAATTPAASTPASTTPAASTPASTTPAASTPASTTPAASTPAATTPAASTPATSNPSSGSVTAEENPTEAPPGNDPFGGFDFGFFDNFAFFQPVAAPPDTSIPASTTPAASSPAATTPAASTPAATTPAASSPASTTPAASTPATSNPSTSTSTSTPTASTPNANTQSSSPVISNLPGSLSVQENQTYVTTVSASDPGGEALSYNLVGPDADALNISSSGEITFKSPPDYETKGSYSITIRVSNNSSTTSQDLFINISDVQENTTPTISGLSASISVIENEIFVVNVNATDPGGEALSYNLVGPDADALNISNSGEITFKSPPDYESKNRYSVTVRVSNSSSTTSQDLIIDITDIDETVPNSAPTISGLASSISVAENQTSLVSISASDSDGDSLTYSLAGADGASFNIDSSGVITFNTPPDFEIKNTYFLTITVSDGKTSTSADLSVSITDVDENPAPAPATSNPTPAPAPTPSNNPPTFSGFGSSISVAENQTSLVTISASDPDGDSLSYTLGGQDASSFSISNSGVITFNSPPDYETKSNYSLTVNVTDGTETVSETIFVNITDVVENTNPTISGLASSVSVPENQTSVVTVTGLDSDGDSLTYSLSGTDYLSLSINSSGVITFNNAPSYTSKSSYSIVVLVSDGRAQVSQDLTINITTAPTLPNLNSSISVNENQTSVVTAQAVTEGQGASLTYSLSGTDASSFTINSSSGVITFNTSPDYETKSSYSLTVSVSDGFNTYSKEVAVSINDVFEQGTVPVISNLASSVSVQENQTSVVSVSASDANGDTLTYSLSGTDASSFTIDSSSGVITFNTSPDYETKNSYSIVVEVSDGANTTTQALTVNVTNVNDHSPSITTSATFSVAENQTAVGTVSASDTDGDTLTYSLSGTDASSFTIDSSSGVITFNTSPDYESKTSYSITVNVSDGNNTDTQALTVNVTNVNDHSPSITTSATFSAAENQTAVGTVSASDTDGDTLTYSLSGTDSSSLSINSSSGVITFNTSPDYESKTSYSITVNVSDGANTTSQSLTVSITDLDENSPVINSSATFSAAENQTAVGTVSASDIEVQSLTYSLSGTDSSSLSINSSSGVITFNTSPDYESKTSYSITVNVSDGANTTSQSLTVNVTNENDNAPVLSTSTCLYGGFCLSPNEEQTTMGTINASDLDGDSISFSLSGEDASSFNISSSGLLTSNTAPDSEGDYSLGSPWYVSGAHQEPDLNIIATDGTNTTTQALTIYVQNTNDNSPAFSDDQGNPTTLSSFSAAENQTSVGSVTHIDGDGQISNYVFSITGTDASSFSASYDQNAFTATITFNSAPDYETKNSYSITLNISDGENTDSQDVTVNVTNVSEPPVVNPATINTNAAGTIQVQENSSTLLNVSATSDPGTTLTYSVSAGYLISNSGVVTFQVPPDFDDVYISGNRNWGSFCSNYRSGGPPASSGWVGGNNGANGCQEGTFNRNNSGSFTVTVNDGTNSVNRTFNYDVTDDPSDIRVGWTTSDPPPYYRPQGGLIITDLYPIRMNEVGCKENHSCQFKLSIFSYSAPQDISISMHSISGTTSDLSEFIWNDYTYDSCRKDYAEYGIGRQNRGVNEQNGYVLKIDKNCLASSNYEDIGFYIWPPKDYETFGAGPIKIYLKITDGTNTTYFPLTYRIQDDPDG